MEIQVQSGDTLSHIALRHLSDARRWPELYALNRERIEAQQNACEARRGKTGPDWIYPGLKLLLTERAK